MRDETITYLVSGVVPDFGRERKDRWFPNVVSGVGGGGGGNGIESCSFIRWNVEMCLEMCYDLYLASLRASVWTNALCFY